jgi:protein SDA1
VISVGVNTVREILARVPALLLEPDMGDFIQDLAQYAHKTHKSVMTAAHGVINLVRELHPTLLKRSDRGRNHDPNAAPGDYGSAAVLSEIPGTELLAAYERGEVDLVDGECMPSFNGSLIICSDGSVDELVWKHERSEEEEDEWEEVEDDEEGDEVEEDGDEAPQLVECEDGDEDEDEEGDWEDCEDDGEGGQLF